MIAFVKSDGKKTLEKMMKTERKKSITTLLVFYMTQILIGAILLSFSAAAVLNYSSVKSEREKTFSELLLQLNNGLSPLLWQLDISAIESFCQTVKVSHVIVSLQVFDDQGTRYCGFSTEHTKDTIIKQTVPIVYDKHPVGKIDVSMKAGLFSESFKNIILLMFVSMTMTILMMVIIGRVVLRKIIARPVQELKLLSALFGSGEYDQTEGRGNIITFSEFVDIEPVMQEMADDITKKQSKLSESQQESQLAVGEKDVADAANQAKSAFLASMSHEIRTPLNAIIGMADMLSFSALKKDQRHMVTTINQASHNLLTIINEILDFSKIEAGKMTSMAGSTSLCDTLQELGNTYNPSARSKGEGIDFFLYVDPAIPDFVWIDYSHLRQIIGNLVGNAIKFTPSTAERKGKIVLYAELDRSRTQSGKAFVTFRITDNGIGIDKAQQKDLFLPFNQADASITRRFGGTGLGLSITHSLVRLMDGEINIKSELGQGSEFSVTLPVRVAEKEYDDLPDDFLSGYRILVYSDDQEHAGFLVSYIKSFSGKAELAENFNDIDTITQNAQAEGAPFKLVVLDGDWRSQKMVDKVGPVIKGLHAMGLLALMTRYAWSDLPSPLINITTSIGDHPLAYRIFIKGIGVAVGLIKEKELLPDAEHTIVPILPPTVHEAEQAGQLILLAEDNLDNQDVIQRQLGMLGYAVLIADNGEEALRYLETHKFGLILTDIHMPVMDGYRFVSCVREREREKSSSERIPILAITAAALSSELDRCYEVGMDGYVTKPIILKDIERVLNQWLPLTPTAPARSSSPPNDIPDPGFDPSIMVDIYGFEDKEMFAKKMEQVMERVENVIRNIIDTPPPTDMNQIREQAHTLKTAVRMIGGLSLGTVFEKIEIIAIKGEALVPEDILIELRTELDALKHCCAEYARTPSAKA